VHLSVVQMASGMPEEEEEEEDLVVGVFSMLLVWSLCVGNVC
jgi:hypothetical protein